MQQPPLPAVSILRLEPEAMKELVAMAADHHMPTAAYLRLLVKQHLRTPLEIVLQPPAAKPKAKARAS